ncbi:MAG: amidohydrolase family protein [Acidimicrobiia bacterium]
MPDARRLPAMQSDPEPEAGVLAITNARVFVAGEVTSPTSVLLDNGRIRQLGGEVPVGVSLIDAEGRTALPGLIDAHAHISMLALPEPLKGVEPLRPGAAAHVLAESLRRALRMGITTIRDVGAHGEVLFELRQAMRLGAFIGPRLFLCGRIVSATAPGDRFFPEMYRLADGADDMRRAAREQIRAGADFVKIMSTGARSVELEDPKPAQVTREEMRALVDEVHRQGYRVAAHCEGLAGTALAIEEGADTIEHGMHLHERPDLLELLAHRGGVLVPTLSFLHDVAESGQWTELLVRQGALNVEAADQTLKAARTAGVPLAMGYDSHEVWRSAHELVRMVEHGLAPAEALTAATFGGAMALGIENEVGSIELGRLADLVLVDGDPLEDPSILTDRQRIWLVLKSGRAVAGAALDPPTRGGALQREHPR